MGSPCSLLHRRKRASHLTEVKVELRRAPAPSADDPVTDEYGQEYNKPQPARRTSVETCNQHFCPDEYELMDGIRFVGLPLNVS